MEFLHQLGSILWTGFHSPTTQLQLFCLTLYSKTPNQTKFEKMHCTLKCYLQTAEAKGSVCGCKSADRCISCTCTCRPLICPSQQVLYWKYDKFTIKTAVLRPITVQVINSSGRTNINKQELFSNLFSLKAQWRHTQSSEIYIAPEVSSSPAQSNRAFV